jgi:hypothetical protein
MFKPLMFFMIPPKDIFGFLHFLMIEKTATLKREISCCSIQFFFGINHRPNTTGKNLQELKNWRSESKLKI